jgi:hypothetical protein
MATKKTKKTEPIVAPSPEPEAVAPVAKTTRKPRKTASKSTTTHRPATSRKRKAAPVAAAAAPAVEGASADVVLAAIPAIPVLEPIATPAAPLPSLEILREEISRLAHQLWVEAGYRHGFADDDWRRAEMIVKSRYGL